MALHIQMSDEALKQLKRAAFMSRLVSLAVCAGFLLGFGTILYISITIIQGDPPAEFIGYTAAAEDGPPTDSPTVKELSAKVSTPTPTVAPSVVVAQNAVGAVAAPVSIDTAGEFEFAEADLSIGVDVDLGEGLGNSGAGLGSSTPGGSALEGTFYDLKLTRSGAPSKIANVITQKDEKGKTVKILKVKEPELMKVAHRFFKEKWRMSILSPYYMSKEKLYASSFYMPLAKDAYAPVAFQCDDVCQPAGWIAVYRGKVRAPKTGKFRFVGAGDDIIVVRFNNEDVLEAGYRYPSLYDEKGNDYWISSTSGKLKDFWKAVKEGKYKQFEGYECISTIKEIPLWNQAIGGLSAGKTFEVKQGQVYPIQVAVIEIPGGGCGFMLMIEDLTDGKKVKPGEKYDLFRTNFSTPTAQELFEMVKNAKDSKGVVRSYHQPGVTGPDKVNMAPYNEDSPIWTAVP